MVLKTDYERDYYYDIDAYLIANYPTMNMDTRRSVCYLALQTIDPEPIEDMIDACVAEYALTKLKLLKAVEDEEDSKEEEEE